MTFDATAVYLYGIPPYLFFSALGVACASSVFILLLLRYGYSVPRYTKVFLYSGIGLLIGAKGFGWLAGHYAALGGDTLLSSGMGLVFYGGMVGFLCTFLLLCKIVFKTVDYAVLDLAVVCFPLFHVWGRIACFFSGCCYGMEAQSPFAILYTTYIGDYAVTASRVPIQLIEAGVNALLFGVLLKLLYNKRLKGRLVFVYLVSYAIARFILEFFRADMDRGIWGGISFSQFVSCLILVFCFICIGMLQSKKKMHEDIR